jgi:hypothetical protein
MSNHGNIENAAQFRGWKQAGSGASAWQWNWCTGGTPELMPPNCEYYNYDDCWTQYDNPLGYSDLRRFAGLWTEPLPWECSEYGGIYTLGGAFMQIWELDTLDDDEYVLTLEYPDYSIVLSPESYGYSGWSESIAPVHFIGTVPQLLHSKN